MVVQPLEITFGNECLAVVIDTLAGTRCLHKALLIDRIGIGKETWRHPFLQNKPPTKIYPMNMFVHLFYCNAVAGMAKLATSKQQG